MFIRWVERAANSRGFGYISFSAKVLFTYVSRKGAHEIKQTKREVNFHYIFEQGKVPRSFT